MRHLPPLALLLASCGISATDYCERRCDYNDSHGSMQTSGGSSKPGKCHGQRLEQLPLAVGWCETSNPRSPSKVMVGVGQRNASSRSPMIHVQAGVRRARVLLVDLEVNQVIEGLVGPVADEDLHAAMRRVRRES